MSSSSRWRRTCSPATAAFTRLSACTERSTDRRWRRRSPCATTPPIKRGRRSEDVDGLPHAADVVGLLGGQGRLTQVVDPGVLPGEAEPDRGGGVPEQV